MKNKVVSVVATALMASGMLFASSLGTLPASTAGASPSGWTSPATGAELPGVVSTQETPTVGLMAGVRPGVGVQTEAMGSASPNSGSLPGVSTVSLTVSNF